MLDTEDLTRKDKGNRTRAGGDCGRRRGCASGDAHARGKRQRARGSVQSYDGPICGHHMTRGQRNDALSGSLEGLVVADKTKAQMK